VFDGDHGFTIEPLGDRRVRVTQQEQFRGILVPLAAKSLEARARCDRQMRR
jgi:hypothetical protein